MDIFRVVVAVGHMDVGGLQDILTVSWMQLLILHEPSSEQDPNKCKTPLTRTVVVSTYSIEYSSI